MVQDIKLSTTVVLASLGELFNLAYPELANHHNRVAYVSLRIDQKMDLTREQQLDLLLASFLHTVGIFSAAERLELREWPPHPHRHSYIAYRLLKNTPGLERFFSEQMMKTILYHHIRWDEVRETSKMDRYLTKIMEMEGGEVPITSYILNLADMVASAISFEKDILTQRNSICEKINKLKGEVFPREVVDAFSEIASKEYFWFHLVSPHLQPYSLTFLRQQLLLWI